MRRVIPALCIIILFAGCEGRWTKTIIKKRIYKDGFYVHVPSKRNTDKYAYLPPSQYPRNYARYDSLGRLNSVYRDTQIVYRDSLIPVYHHIYTYDTLHHVPPQYANGFPSDTLHRYVMKDTVITRVVVDTLQRYVIRDSIIPVVKMDTVMNYLHDTLHHVVMRDSIVDILDTTYIVKYDSIRRDKQIVVHEPKSEFHFPETEFAGVIQLGFMNDAGNNNTAVKWNSNSFATGLRMKMKMKGRQSLMIDGMYRRDKLIPEQNALKGMPFVPGMFDKEHLNIHEISGALCIRHTFRPHHEKPAWWVDAGIYGGRIFRDRDVAWANDITSPLGDHVEYQTTVTSSTGLKKGEHGLTLRVGRGMWSGFAMCRLSGMTKGNAPSDLPRFIVGVELTLGE